MSSKFKLYWISHQILDYVANISTTIFINFYIWEHSQNFSSILKFNLGLFLIYPLAVFIGTVLIEFLGLKFSQIFSKILQALFIFLLLFLGVRIIQDSFTFGLLTGLVLGTAFATIDVITGKIEVVFRVDINSKIKIGTITAGMIFPLLFSVLVDSRGNFTIPFLFALGIYLFLFLTSTLVTFPSVDGRLNLLEIFKFPGGNPEKSILLKSAFLSGLKNSIHYSIIGVLTLHFVGSITNWGRFTLALSIFSLFLVFIYKKLTFSRQSILSLGLGAMVYLIGSAYFVYDFSLIGIYVYMVATAIFDVFYGFGITGTMIKLTEIDSSPEDLTAEYTFFTSLFTSIGMIIPIAFLDYFKLDLHSPTFFLGVIIFIAFIPFTILKVMSNSFYLTHDI